MHEKNLLALEEFDITEKVKTPHLSYVIGTLLERKNVAYSVFRRRSEDVLLIESFGFLIDSVFAGLSEKHIEYIAKNGPKEYKENIAKIINNREMMQGVVEIVKAMDEDLGRNITKNQDRIKSVIQYISDNKVVFKFQ